MTKREGSRFAVPAATEQGKFSGTYNLLDTGGRCTMLFCFFFSVRGWDLVATSNARII